MGLTVGQEELEKFYGREVNINSCIQMIFYLTR